MADARTQHPGYGRNWRSDELMRNALKAVYLQADVCRQDLLLENEATAAHPLVFMSGQRD
jgi:hypothetical protein